MKNIKFLVLFWVIGVVLSCSKDDDNALDNIAGGEIYTYQVVNISVPGINLAETSYEGYLGETKVTLIRSSENTLCFTVSPLAALGKADLTIPMLNATIHYDVKDTQLTDTPDHTLAGFFANLDTYTQQIGTPQLAEHETALKLITAFNDIYDDATTEEKEAIAKFYKVNKQMFDDVMLMSINGAQGKLTATDAAEIAQGTFMAAIKGLVTGAAILVVGDWLVSQPGVYAAVKILGAVIGGVALGLVVSSLIDFCQAKSTANQVSAGNVFGENNIIRGTNDIAVYFTDNVELITPFHTYRRTVNETDATSTNTLMVQFFKGYEVYASIIDKVNQAITFVNTRTFITISAVTLRGLPPVTPSEPETLTNEIFNRLSLSITDPDVELVSAILQPDGQLKIKVKIVGPASLDNVDAKLNYSYDDAFSDFSGTIRIHVTRQDDNPLTGTWTMASFNGGYLPGQFEPIYTIANCPGIAPMQQTYNYETIVFTANNTFTFANERVLVNLNYVVNYQNCTVTADNPDTQEVTVGADNGTYTLNGTNLTFAGQEETLTDPIIFLTDNKIQIGEQVYNRQ